MKQIIEHNANGKMIYTYWDGDKEHLITKEDALIRVSADPDNVEIKTFAESVQGLAKAANEYAALRMKEYNEKSLAEQFGMIYDILETLAPTSDWIVWQKAIKAKYPK